MTIRDHPPAGGAAAGGALSAHQQIDLRERWDAPTTAGRSERTR
ncbi:MAG: hypothetical protein ACTHJJ_06305 [Intrasporangium sp.]